MLMARALRIERGIRSIADFTSGPDELHHHVARRAARDLHLPTDGREAGADQLDRVVPGREGEDLGVAGGAPERVVHVDGGVLGPYLEPDAARVRIGLP